MRASTLLVSLMASLAIAQQVEKTPVGKVGHPNGKGVPGSKIAGGKAEGAQCYCTKADKTGGTAEDDAVTTAKVCKKSYQSEAKDGKCYAPGLSSKDAKNFAALCRKANSGDAGASCCDPSKTNKGPHCQLSGTPKNPPTTKQGGTTKNSPTTKEGETTKNPPTKEGETTNQGSNNVNSEEGTGTGTGTTKPGQVKAGKPNPAA